MKSNNIYKMGAIQECERERERESDDKLTCMGTLLDVKSLSPRHPPKIAWGSSCRPRSTRHGGWLWNQRINSFTIRDHHLLLRTTAYVLFKCPTWGGFTVSVSVCPLLTLHFTTPSSTSEHLHEDKHPTFESLEWMCSHLRLRVRLWFILFVWYDRSDSIRGVFLNMSLFQIHWTKYELLKRFMRFFFPIKKVFIDNLLLLLLSYFKIFNVTKISLCK